MAITVQPAEFRPWGNSLSNSHTHLPVGWLLIRIQELVLRSQRWLLLCVLFSPLVAVLLRWRFWCALRKPMLFGFGQHGAARMEKDVRRTIQNELVHEGKMGRARPLNAHRVFSLPLSLSLSGAWIYTTPFATVSAYAASGSVSCLTASTCTIWFITNVASPT